MIEKKKERKMRVIRGPIGRNILNSRGKGIEQPLKTKRRKEENCVKVWTPSKNVEKI